MFHPKPAFDSKEVLQDALAHQNAFDVAPSSAPNHLKFKHSNEELVYNIQNGIDAMRSKDLLVRKNSGLVYSVVVKCHYNIPLEDKMQYGYEALLEAANKFDLSSENKFTTYAQTAINLNLYDRGSLDNNIIQIPKYLSVASITINKFCERYIDKHQKEPLPEFVAQELNMSLNTIKAVRVFKNHYQSFDTPISSSDSEKHLSEVISGRGADYVLNESVYYSSLEEQIEKTLEQLEEHERILFGLYFGVDGYRKQSLDEILEGGYYDQNGKQITSKTTLHRKLHNLLDKIKGRVQRNLIM